MKIKTTVKYHYISTRMSKIEKANNASVGKDMEQRILLVGIQNGANTLENCLAVSCKVKFTFTMCSSNSLLVISLTRNKNAFHTETCTEVYITASFVVAPNGNQQKHPSTGDHWYI